MSNVKNISKAVGNTVAAATGIVSVGTEVIADTSGLISNGISATPSVFKALLVTPFSAAKGYLVEAEGLSDKEAEAVAFHYLEQDVTTTVRQGGEGAGKLLAQLFEEDADDDLIITSEKKEVNDK